MHTGHAAGFVVWFTGLSGAGKSTLAQALAARLLAAGQKVEVLDGDVVRENLSQGLGFSREDRDINIRRIAFVAKLLARNGVIVIVAAISPYRAARDEARASIGRFLEVHVQCPIDELVRRDTKGLYARALAAHCQTSRAFPTRTRRRWRPRSPCGPTSNRSTRASPGCWRQSTHAAFRWR